MDAGYYKFHEAYHLLKFNDERQMLKKAYAEYCRIKKDNKNRYKINGFYKKEELK